MTPVNSRHDIPAMLVQVRYSSKRLPGKVLMKIGGQTLIQRIHDRLTSLLPFPVYFLTSTDQTDDVIVDHLEDNKISYYRGNLNNVLERFIMAGESLGYDKFFRITGDNPFVDVHTIKEHWGSFLKFDYVDNIHGEGNVIGTGFEYVTLKALKKVPLDTNEYYKEHVTAYVRDNAKMFNSFRFVPDHTLQQKDVFLTCDYIEDFKLIEKVFEHFDHSNYIRICDILAYLYSRTDLSSINKHLHESPSY